MVKVNKWLVGGAVVVDIALVYGGYNVYQTFKTNAKTEEPKNASQESEPERMSGLILYRRTEADKQPRYLLLQAAYDEKLWCIPKAASLKWTYLGASSQLHRTYTPLEAATRETQLLTGLDSTKDYMFNEDFKCVLRYEIPSKQNSETTEKREIHYYLANVLDSAKVELAREMKSFAWLNKNEAVSKLRLTDMVLALKQADEYLRTYHEND